MQRFGSSLNLNVHLHVAVVDGVFSRDDRGVSFTPAPPPTYSEMLAVIRAVRARMEKLSPAPPSTTEDHPLDACARIALSRGEVAAVTASLDDDELAAPPSDGAAVDDAGYNLEASVRIAAGDDFGREHLLRYCARPPLSLARLIELPMRKIGYRIKKLRNGRAKLRVMTPLELLARLAALVPPPRHPLVRFHGAFAPRSSWRRDVVPKPCEPPTKEPAHTHAPKPPPQSPPPAPAPPTTRRRQSPAALVARTELLAPNVLAVHHWNRLQSGALVTTSPRVDWAKLMRRTFDVDVLECPQCAGKLRIVAVVEDEAVAAAILDELGIARAPPVPRARDPATLEADPPDDAPT